MLCSVRFVKNRRKRRHENAEKWKLADEITRGPSRNCETDKNYNEYVESYVKNYESLWTQKSLRKWRTEDFRVNCLKNRVLDRFADKVLDLKKQRGKMLNFPPRVRELRQPDFQVCKTFREKSRCWW